MIAKRFWAKRRWKNSPFAATAHDGEASTESLGSSESAESSEAADLLELSGYLASPESRGYPSPPAEPLLPLGDQNPTSKLVTSEPARPTQHFRVLAIGQGGIFQIRPEHGVPLRNKTARPAHGFPMPQKPVSTFAVYANHRTMGLVVQLNANCEHSCDRCTSSCVANREQLC
jgi:hypothetical protein